MATLNVKNFPDQTYEKLKELAAREHRSLGQQVVHMLSEAVEKPRPRSILALRGLGKELWESVDVERYLTQERGSWD